MYPIEYKAIIYEEDEGKNTEVKGVTFAESFAQGMEYIQGYYGDALIEVSLFMLEEGYVYDFNETTYSSFHGKFKIEKVTEWN